VVTGDDLLLIEPGDLKAEFGVISFGHRKRFLKALADLKLQRAVL
jgi:hypothetical protein